MDFDKLFDIEGEAALAQARGQRVELDAETVLDMIAEIAALRDALAPFAKAGTEMRKPPLSEWLTGSAIVWSGGDAVLRPADFYHAEDAMTSDAPAPARIEDVEDKE